MFSPEQMAAYNTKAAMYREEGKYSEARDLLHHGLRSARDTMGEDAEVTMSMMHNYGALLVEMGKNDEGAPLLEEAYDRRVEILGETHKDTLQTMSNLAICYQRLGKQADAIKMYKELVNSRSKLDKDSLEAHEATAQLCSLYCDANRLEDAVLPTSEMLSFYVAKFGKGCREHVPQSCLTAGSKVFSALIQRPEIKGGALLQAVLMAIMKGDDDPQVGGTPPPALATPAAPPPGAPPVLPPAHRPLSSTEIATMSDLLRAIELPQYVAAFEEEEMELAVMRDAMARQGRAAVDDVLKELGVQSMGHRTKIANALAGV